MKKVYTFWAVLAGWCVLMVGHLASQPQVPKSTGQQGVTSVATALPLQTTGVVCVKAVPGNAATVYVSNLSTVSTTTGYPLNASESLCAQASNLATFYVITATPPTTVAWFTFNNFGQ